MARGNRPVKALPRASSPWWAGNMSISNPTPDPDIVDPEAVSDERDLDPEVPAHHKGVPDETPVEAQP